MIVIKEGSLEFNNGHFTITDWYVNAEDSDKGLTLVECILNYLLKKANES